jgi:NitT/TauT family transport system ATP-binding protein
MTRTALAVEVSQVSKSFASNEKSEVILQNVSLQVQKGEIVSLLGQSGCGKSTLLSIIGGFTKPDSGQVRLSGQAKETPSRNCVMLFQNYGLLPWRSVKKNVELGLEHLPAPERSAIAMDYLRMVGLADRIDYFPHQLSGGMQQRVAIARALALRPEVILMDEPFGALDTFTRYHLQNELLRIHDQEKPTILFVTHDIDEAVYVSDRVLIMGAKPGKIHKEIAIHTSRPRDRGNADFQHYRKQILEQFELSGNQTVEEFSI